MIRESRPDEQALVGELRVTAYGATGLLSASSGYAETLRGFGFGDGCTVLVAVDDASGDILGTLRFGNDPRTSVCDATGRFHDIGNLYCADGALFPTSSGFNPTMTITALSMYVAAGIAYPGSPMSALP